VQIDSSISLPYTTTLYVEPNSYYITGVLIINSSPSSLTDTKEHYKL